MNTKKRPKINSDTAGEGLDDDGLQNSVRLLLHTSQGLIPYLTGRLLEKYFEPVKVADVLLLGIAVRETCVVPVFSQDGDGTTNKKKPRGYSFAFEREPDQWVLPYKRVTVPSFDLIQDGKDHLKKTKNKGGKDASSSNTQTGSGESLMVWTSNGRQAMTPEAYFNSSHGLQSHVTVSMFDLCESSAKTKRKQAVAKRNYQWLKDALEKFQTKLENQETWASVALTKSEEKEGNVHYREEDDLALKQLHLIQHSTTISGVTFVDWTYASNSYDEQKLVLKNAIEKFRNIDYDSTPKTLSILSCHSLLQFLDAASLGIQVIGTNLPTNWSLHKKAFVCEISQWEEGTSNSNKRPRTEKIVLNTDGCIDLEADASHWKLDDEPMLSGCTCFACSNHSRAYIYHLVLAKELLAEILLFAHNLHHTLLLCREFSKARAQKREDDFCHYIKSQLGSAVDSRACTANAQTN